MFAQRISEPLKPNRLSRTLERIKALGGVPIDLTELNPTRAGFQYPRELLKDLQVPENLSYEPDPKGLQEARQAVALIYAAKGLAISAEQVVLTASTSEAYSFLFKLLANGGEEILFPKPGYPLFSHLAALNDVKPLFYPLRYDKRWWLDLAALKKLLSARTRAVVVVHSNHPTGSCLRREELKELFNLSRSHAAGGPSGVASDSRSHKPEGNGAASFSRSRGLALIADEVFAEYLTDEDPRVPPTLLGSNQLLQFSLGGVSKFMGLPQMKLSWIVVAGPRDQVKGAVQRLELIADTYLSVNGPVQRAFPRWLNLSPMIQAQIRARITENRRKLLELLQGHPVQCLQADGGWTAVLHIPTLQDEEEWVVRLLTDKRVLVHPGYFYDFDESGHLVISLIMPPDLFEEGIRRLLTLL